MKYSILSAFVILIISTSGIWAIEDNDSLAIPPIDTAWKTTGIITATFAQSHFSDNWSAGGEPSLALNSRVHLSAIYLKKNWLWQNSFDLAYGFTNQKNSIGFRKNDDLIEINSAVGYKASEKWFYTTALNLKTQLDKGYNYTDTGQILISNFLAPAYLNLALGMEYRPNANLSAFLSPVNLKYTYVNDDSLVIMYSIDSEKNSKTELGALLKVKYQQNITENISLLSKLDVFYDYINSPDIPYVCWEVLANVKVYKMLSINLNTLLIYDENVKVLNAQGIPETAKIQFKEIFGVGLAYMF